LARGAARSLVACALACRPIAIATKNGKCRIFRKAGVRFREPAEVEATAARALDDTQMLAGVTEAGA
jgi:hypothetical protein